MQLKRNGSSIPINNELAVYRLTALWAFVECGLGGVLHALKIPVTGLFVGGMAIIILSLIAHYAPENPHKAIFKALSLVLIIKLAVTPHSGVGALLAVSFQGIAAAILFRFLPFAFAVLILAPLAMVESAGQKVLLLWLLFGHDLIDSINQTSESIFKNFGLKTSLNSGRIVLIYILVHFIWGILISFFIVYLRNVIQTKSFKKLNFTALEMEVNEEGVRKTRPRSRMPILLFFLGLFILIYLWYSGQVQSIYFLLIRLALVLFILVKVIGPAVRRLLSIILKKKKENYLLEVEQITDFLPVSSAITKYAWKINAKRQGVARMLNFILDTLVYHITYEPKDHLTDRSGTIGKDNDA